MPVEICETEDSLQLFDCVRSRLLDQSPHLGVINGYALLSNNVPQERNGGRMKLALLSLDIKLVLPVMGQHFLDMVSVAP